jgi:hypothetical protein
MTRYPRDETDPVAEPDLTAHEAATTAVHGIDDTSKLVELAVDPATFTDDQRPAWDSAQRKFIAGDPAMSIPDASVTIKGVSELSVPPASSANPIAAGDNDPRMSDARSPSGPAGGALSGAYPDPAFAQDMATQAELDAESSARGAADAAHAALAVSSAHGTVKAADLDTTLKPSGSAAATDEAVRRLGTGSTHSAAGDDSRFPTTGQKNALAGSSGTPGSTNPYVTDQDARNTNARTPISHASSHASAGSDPITIAESQVTNLPTDLAAKAPLDSPTFIGDPKAPTPPQGDNDTSIATTAYVQTEAGLLVPKSLVDAKGDLLVGTADNTVARKAAGTNGQTLTADSTQTDGLKWATPPQLNGKVIGAYYTTIVRDRNGFQTGSGTAAGVLVCTPIWLEAGTLDRLAQQSFSTAAGESVRLGIYSDNGTGRPGPLLIDGGSIDLSAGTGIKTVTISQAVARGLYWLAVVRQGGNTSTILTIDSAGAGRIVIPSMGTAGTNLYDAPGGFIMTGVTGALPGTFTGSVMTASGASFPPGFVRYSA